jgi:DAACS family dicarboxylate/amino acid:cation (Na+ or H+) symporter
MEIKAKRGLPLHMLMLIGFLVGLTGGLIVNLTVGGDVGWVQWLTSNITGPAGQIFLRLLFMLVLPLLFSALVIGVAEMGDLKALGRAGSKSLGFTVFISAVAVLIGMVMVNVFRGPATGLIRPWRNNCWIRDARARPRLSAMRPSRCRRATSFWS